MKCEKSEELEKWIQAAECQREQIEQMIEENGNLNFQRDEYAKLLDEQSKKVKDLLLENNKLNEIKENLKSLIEGKEKNNIIYEQKVSEVNYLHKLLDESDRLIQELRLQLNNSAKELQNTIEENQKLQKQNRELQQNINEIKEKLQNKY